MSREVEQGCKSWTSFTSSCCSTAVHRTLSLSLCPSTAVETAIARCTSRWAMARGHSLNTSIVLAALHGLSSLFQAVSTVEPSLFRPLPLPPPPPPHTHTPLSPSLISHLTSVDVKAKWSRLAVMMLGETCLKQSSLELSVCSHSLVPKVIFRPGSPTCLRFVHHWACTLINFFQLQDNLSFSFMTASRWLGHLIAACAYCNWKGIVPVPLCPSPVVSQPIVPQSHCVPVPLCPSPVVSQPIVPQSHCVPVPLCPSPVVSQPIVPQSHCVPVPLCPSPVMS